MAGRRLTQVLASSAVPALEAVAQGVGLTATRLDAVRTLGLGLSAAVALLHRLAPALRLM